jgi:hypothetical protein
MDPITAATIIVATFTVTSGACTAFFKILHDREFRSFRHEIRDKLNALTMKIAELEVRFAGLERELSRRQRKPND